MALGDGFDSHGDGAVLARGVARGGLAAMQGFGHGGDNEPTDLTHWALEGSTSIAKSTSGPGFQSQNN
ncbi:hypothetical protein L1987_78049 [Smallanthus sonchifolius]|uniref:Uncharacterized protein n=1 Tax=Smallanthus sonchifolius TaxID=185202 RepID=A0ACB8ZBD5_9ASTR|nr:hypothetical protein L1987_78049 [Smallanthus sonchifolius]